MDIQTITTAGVAVLILLFLVSLILFTRKKRKENVQETMGIFMESFKDAIIDVVLETISKSELKFKSINDIAELEKKILEEIYKAVYEFLFTELESLYEQKVISSAVIKQFKKFFTLDKVREYVTVLIDGNKEISVKISDVITVAFNNSGAAERMLEEDSKREKELEESCVEDIETFQPEDEEDKEIHVVDPVKGETIEQINPPTDEESEVVEEGTYEEL